jgi:heme-degrading monooxygenase HmoA
MIARIFRVCVPRPLHQEFEQKFLTISIPYVKQHSGLISVTIGRPTSQCTDEYVMLSIWKSQEDIENFAGKDWFQAVIPQGMAKYVQVSWVHHYEIFSE